VDIDKIVEQVLSRGSWGLIAGCIICFLLIIYSNCLEVKFLSSKYLQVVAFTGWAGSRKGMG